MTASSNQLTETAGPNASQNRRKRGLEKLDVVALIQPQGSRLIDWTPDDPNVGTGLTSTLKRLENECVTVRCLRPASSLPEMPSFSYIPREMLPVAQAASALEGVASAVHLLHSLSRQHFLHCLV